MSEATLVKTVVSGRINPTIPTRILEEGYGPGAWHGADLRAAVDVPTDVAFWRPAKQRHNIAEIAVHHAWCVHSVIGSLTGTPEKDFPLEGNDWFELVGEKDMKWKAIVGLVEAKHQRLAAVVADIDGGRVASPLSPAERFDLVLGVTCHAIYHAGQIQLIRALRA